MSDRVKSFVWLDPKPSRPRPQMILLLENGKYVQLDIEDLRSLGRMLPEYLAANPSPDATIGGDKP